MARVYRAVSLQKKYMEMAARWLQTTKATSRTQDNTQENIHEEEDELRAINAPRTHTGQHPEGTTRRKGQSANRKRARWRVCDLHTKDKNKRKRETKIRESKSLCVRQSNGKQAKKKKQTQKHDQQKRKRRRETDTLWADAG